MRDSKEGEVKVNSLYLLSIDFSVPFTVINQPVKVMFELSGKQNLTRNVN